MKFKTKLKAPVGKKKNSLESIRNDHALDLIVGRWNPLISLKSSKCCGSTLGLVWNHPTNIKQTLHLTHVYQKETVKDLVFLNHKSLTKSPNV